uniref:4-hydroxy-3-methylbut-2-en-1-yl diphosphate synthase (ferredoxin), chloroplastic n=1 Tax=Pyramimonas obovata TaxID=1411642 RepID=A0A7S0WSW2_9CHLO|eukprot:CAMPEP_0118925380 /NCGR_PEP_ID=MMETSP1169-20130426/3261_1 /TAXON_ID=36882 /ORGANISM="Pyramimonas obovata, Strain CCMP722" /LENGTH=738 /DNA_ID=CAMNT_0006866651 /DNA_START=57 /DNA_END=2273 /DNA_ORIENTATION=+
MVSGTTIKAPSTSKVGAWGNSVAPVRVPSAVSRASKSSRKVHVVRAADDKERLLMPELVVPASVYCEQYNKTKRRPTRTIMVGNVPIGSEHPIALQTMTTTDTRDVKATVEEVKRCADAGADLVRITVQGMMEANACHEIREQLFKDRYDTPLVADMHFAPKVAVRVAEAFEKIRINPGNFADGRKTFEEIDYESPEQYAAEVEYAEEIFTPLVEKCKSLNRAMRIGTNHGSLSARILSYYGDTPRGMVESAFEFARVCRKNDYHNFLFSMKASNPLVMVQAYRLLAAEMYEQGYDYPIHLGVTEAGEGEDGRMKSAIGIGALLMDGIGDTIRVSLTEAPELEMEPCGRLAKLGTAAVAESWGVEEFGETTRNFREFGRRVGDLPEQREGDTMDYRGLLHRDGSVLSAVTLDNLQAGERLYKELACKLVVGMPFKDIATSDSIFLREVPPADDAEARRTLKRLQDVNVGVLAPIAALQANPLPNSVAVVSLKEFAAAGGKVELPEGAQRVAVTADGTESEAELAVLKGSEAVKLLLNMHINKRVHASRRVFDILKKQECNIPVIHHLVFTAEDDNDQVVIHGGSVAGALLVDGLGDGVMLESPDKEVNFLRNTSFGMLQGSRMRNTKTDFVSCPSCGRTLFDLQEVTANISSKTGHLPGVSIAIMGCIVNGPGEMADADFGYVGTLPGKIDLYVGKEVVKKNINEDIAVDALIQLIKDNDRWVEPEPVEEEPAEAVAA